MRPIRLELSGFTAFREPTVVDFEGCEYFAFCGPTGAGKSSLIDAMCFALYGAVPRLGDKQVAPVISQGLIEATVRLDFTVDGVLYSAIRKVRRTKTGGTTPEARLQRGDEVLAGSADAVTYEVEKLVGLSYKHFTKCVVLPQGKFAEFLHATLTERHDLLKQLLDMEMYDRMGKQANQMSIAAKSYVQILQRRLDEDLAFATAEARDEHAVRLVHIQELAFAVEQAQPLDQALTRDEERSREQAAVADARVSRLKNLRAPAGFKEQSQDIAAARTVQDQALKELTACEHHRTTSEHLLGELPKRSDLELAAQAFNDHSELELQLTQSRSTLSRLIQNEADAVKEQEAADERHKSAFDSLESTKLEHRAHELATTLIAGDPCPVCRQVVHEAPILEAARDLYEAEQVLSTAKRNVETSRTVRAEVEKKRFAEETRIQEHESRLETIKGRMTGYQDLAVLQSLLSEVAKAELNVQKARAAEKSARVVVDESANRLRLAEQAERNAWKLYDAARDSVGELDPPPAIREDLSADWVILTQWASSRIETEAEAALEARAREQQASAERKALRAELANNCRALGIEPAPTVSQAVMNALAEQQARCARMEAALIEVENIKADLARAAEEQSVSSKLGQHLSAKGFEKWLLDEAVRGLLEQASKTLHELSGNAYSLELDDRSNFVVIDHRNAGERRLAKTLSGGETFLASLSLALALSVRLAEIASDGVRLDAIFLDEGFGTLDPETLDVVASAMEGLATQRMVGLITHVPSIGERVPVRFEVSKDADTSRVVRVDN